MNNKRIEERIFSQLSKEATISTPSSSFLQGYISAMHDVKAWARTIQLEHDRTSKDVIQFANRAIKIMNEPLSEALKREAMDYDERKY